MDLLRRHQREIRQTFPLQNLKVQGGEESHGFGAVQPHIRSGNSPDKVAPDTRNLTESGRCLDAGHDRTPGRLVGVWSRLALTLFLPADFGALHEIVEADRGRERIALAQFPG